MRKIPPTLIPCTEDCSISTSKHSQKIFIWKTSLFPPWHHPPPPPHTQPTDSYHRHPSSWSVLSERKDHFSKCLYRSVVWCAMSPWGILIFAMFTERGQNIPAARFLTKVWIKSTAYNSQTEVYMYRERQLTDGWVWHYDHDICVRREDIYESSEARIPYLHTLERCRKFTAEREREKKKREIDMINTTAEN